MKKRLFTSLILVLALTTSAFGEGKSAMKIKISSGQTVLTATMLDNATSRDFMSMLPLTLMLKDYAGTEKISNLPRKLSTEGAPRGSDPSVGDIALYAPWGNLALYYREFRYSSGLIILGKVSAGGDRISQLNGEVRIERIK